MCHPTKLQTTLFLSSGAAALVDTYATQRIFPGAIELNPLQRPFQTHGKAVAYTSAVAETYLYTYLGDRMKHSRYKIVRALWFVPPAFMVQAHVRGAQFTISRQLGRH